MDEVGDLGSKNNRQQMMITLQKHSLRQISAVFERNQILPP